MSMLVTMHFSIEEFACRDGSAYPISQCDEDDKRGRTWLETRLLPLCETLEVIRAAAGGTSITIDSGYRTLAYDTRLYQLDNGAGNVAKPQGSQHPKGRAADITHETLDPGELHLLIYKLFVDGKLPYLGGLGLYPNFVHVDVRPRRGTAGGDNDGHLAQWGGTRQSNQT